MTRTRDTTGTDEGTSPAGGSTARRRYLAVDPTNRLVADQLEADWNNKLRELADAKDEYERATQTGNRPLTDEQGSETSSPAPSRTYTRSARQLCRRLTNSNSCPAHGWNGCVTRTRDKPLRSSASRAVDESIQRPRRGTQQQGQADRPPRVRVPLLQRRARPRHLTCGPVTLTLPHERPFR